MTRAEAEERARMLQAEDPERDTHRFVPRQSPDGGWPVAKVEVPEQLRRGKLTPTVEARPRPTQPDDPAAVTSGACRASPAASASTLP